MTLLHEHKKYKVLSTYLSRDYKFGKIQEYCDYTLGSVAYNTTII